MSVDASNSSPAGLLDGVRAKVAGAIKQAADSVGASFEYLLSTAKMESDFNPTAGASTSSARGLYQFIDQTWLGTVKEAGADLGYGQYADAITRTSSGDYTVSDPGMRQAIMKLRDDPKASSAMAAALTQSNSFQLTAKIGRRPSDSELYMAHFMGVGGAAKLITSAQDTPSASAAQMFPNAAVANRSIFYDRDGQARSVSQVYSVLNTRYAGAANSSTTRGALALYGGSSPNVAVANSAGGGALPTTDTATFLSMFPDARGAQAASATTADASAGRPADPMFRSLFQVDGQSSQAVSPTVRELWGRSPVASADSADAGSNNTGSGSGQRRLDLFSDPNGTFSG
ncbi:transglycosylase [Bradyrhizobium sp. SSBR45G]|uniref:lytic transglycosylase domain-containing protein n=1 Tax=unclassified Bradyrhizobium TaxID=2631580 RepID=UPI0023429FA6|nr:MULTISPECIES: lytic transglycosylase domain-containing protein [unclassified Bradyrhizobium]GLH77819.1 transglycosylase [Bradyrhizobium sp. SSBR45G]GLH85560.1 transglycosylase [Bradyrhizobium sp. SSBR45R]